MLCAKISLRYVSRFYITSRQINPLIFTSDDDLCNPIFMNSIESPTPLKSLDENQITGLISELVSPKSLLNTYASH